MRKHGSTLSANWGSILADIARAIRKVSALPEDEQDQEFNDWLQGALLHAESREAALIDPC